MEERVIGGCKARGQIGVSRDAEFFRGKRGKLRVPFKPANEALSGGRRRRGGFHKRFAAHECLETGLRSIYHIMIGPEYRCRIFNATHAGHCHSSDHTIHGIFTICGNIRKLRVEIQIGCQHFAETKRGVFIGGIPIGELHSFRRGRRVLWFLNRRPLRNGDG